MSEDIFMINKNIRSAFAFIIFIACLICFASCNSTKTAAPVSDNTNQNSETASAPEAAEQPAEVIDPTLLDRLRNEHWKGDIDGLLERRYIRVLVLYNKTNFFYDGPQPRGVTYEAGKEFEKYLNAKLNTGKTPLYVVFIPVTREDGLQRMQDGRGDIAASGIPIIPEFEQVVDFSIPFREDSKEIVVTGSAAPAISSLDDLSGKEVFVRKHSRYWPNLVRLNDQFKQSGKSPIVLQEADANLEDEDILNMVNAGLVGITIMDNLIADLWAGVFDGIKVHDDITLAEGDRIAWAVQKGKSPKLLELLNEFVKDHKTGTSFGNTLLRRYLKDTKWAVNNTAPTEVEKFKAAVGLFKKYGAEYDFDWLMIAAQAYQESQIDQSRRSPAGAVGVMQIKPSTAADKNINIQNVENDIDKNINAGVKYLDFIMETYFKDAKMNRLNRGLFAFASYNAGPARVAKLRKMAAAEGLNPDLWFNNVELIAAREIGAETVTYVSNIYKYYVAYKMVSEQQAAKQKSKS
ncbi:MAG: lytic transglycosylase F [Acidobacteria bacterium]|nr:MAG: lytic transglycosylase F [Acidobacteriota bacterium]